MPRISIILPTYSGARFLARAIKSVQAQTVTDFELLVIIDGSTDNSKEIALALSAADPRIKIIAFEANHGIQRALAAGFRVASGEYVARIDDDDVWSDINKLQSQLDFFAQNPECVLVGTGLIVEDEQEKELFRFLNPLKDSEIRATILYRNCFSHSTVMFKRSAALRFGGYTASEAVRHVEDYDLWLKLGTVGTLANLPEYSVRLTSHGTSISGTHKVQQFKNQLAITAGYKGKYPHYAFSRYKSYARLWAYQLFGSFIPASARNRFIKFYKS